MQMATDCWTHQALEPIKYHSYHVEAKRTKLKKQKEARSVTSMKSVNLLKTFPVWQKSQELRGISCRKFSPCGCCVACICASWRRSSFRASWWHPMANWSVEIYSSLYIALPFLVNTIINISCSLYVDMWYIHMCIQSMWLSEQTVVLWRHHSRVPSSLTGWVVTHVTL